MGIFSRLKEGLAKTRQGLVEKIESLVSGRKVIDESLYEELEEALIAADVGVEVSLELMEALRRRVREQKVKDPGQLKPLLQELILEVLEEGRASLERGGPPTVVLVVGVNGTGKTTTIGKLAHFCRSRGERVILAAADTFRAAAIDQLEIWGRRAGAEVIKHREGADPAAVAFDAVQAARARRADIVFIDTAGRLHTKSNLMEELKKIRRVVGREVPGAPHEVLLVLDATTGQNALSQARLFGEAVGVTGIVLTKLDGTAKGGVIIGIRRSLGIPVKFIGIGEGIDDLQPFNPREFVEALFATG
ncbi:signal recognition particle-docking protein FtsY [Desulfovirgula thermocuniculi]|uniref:signal recognition particle-docking protein FtsY n=1 Tax=Desulfovirgula thermocuniculi TaxID=348842 RepID=UPI000401E4CE|nr:signal recognition particle-docking protein FtsY [Desulfovirgula thermocuniculi]